MEYCLRFLVNAAQYTLAIQEGACMNALKLHDRDIRLSQTQTSAVSEHTNKSGHYPLWDKVTFIARDPHWYSRRVKEAIHIWVHPNNTNRDWDWNSWSVDAYNQTIRQHDNQSLPQQTAEGSVSSSHNANNPLNRSPPSMSEVCDTPITNNHGGKSTISPDEDLQCAVVTSRSISKWQYINRETNDKTKPFIRLIWIQYIIRGNKS